MCIRFVWALCISTMTCHIGVVFFYFCELQDSLEEGKDTKLGDLDKGVLDATDVNTGELDCTVR